MRLSVKTLGASLAMAILFLPLAARAQNPDMVAPEASEARAKQILNQLIQAMGGPLYLDMRERQCDGRRAAIGHNGALAGYVQFKDSWEFPDKNRTDYTAHGRNTLLGYMVGVQELDLSHGGLVITLFSGEHGWTMDRGGVSEEPAAAVHQVHDRPHLAAAVGQAEGDVEGAVGAGGGQGLQHPVAMLRRDAGQQFRSVDNPGAAPAQYGAGDVGHDHAVGVQVPRTKASLITDGANNALA